MQKELSQFKIADIIDVSQPIISINEDQNIGEALLLLKKHNILCLVITDSENNNIGFLDVIDIVVAIMVAGISFKVIEAIGCYTVEECTENEKVGFTSISVKEIIGNW